MNECVNENDEKDLRRMFGTRNQPRRGSILVGKKMTISTRPVVQGANDENDD